MHDYVQASNGYWSMQNIIPLGAAGALLLLTAIPAVAGTCKTAIDEVQAQADAAIESRAGSGPWRSESVGATLGYQPTPRSLADTEGAAGQRYRLALTALSKARTADDSGDLVRCNAELDKARRAFQSP